MTEQSSFTIDLVSNGSMDIYPNNTISSFQNRIDPPLELSGDWEVALTEIYFPLKFSGEAEIKYKIKSKYFYKQATGRKILFQDAEWVDASPEQTISFFVSEPRKKVFEKLNQSFKEAFKPPSFAPRNDVTNQNLEISENKLSLGMIFDNETTKHIIEHVLPEHKDTVLFDTWLDGNFTKAKQFAFGKAPYHWVYSGLIYAPFFTTEVKKYLGMNHVQDSDLNFHKPRIYLQPTEKFNLEAKKNDAIFLMYLYTDIIQDHIVGGTQSPVLRALPLTSGIYKDTGYCTFSHRIYYPVRKNHIGEISVLATHDSGEQVYFESGGRMFLSLDFRKKTKVV